ncbi:expressed unknown protein [Seminavis robusta]|uniref:Uncharacterized protein n=1 Tax=Seminavis robusta TaxID=568900 RepID=A0A9N8DZ19_9STRA|nr:expressed unknown protein [Seminavis robusta]|eukprot:Sro390_g132830.1 n/a (124) ;mRNA; r:31639-32010
MKAMMPAFRLKSNFLTIEPGKRGRILLEWIPRSADGRHAFDNTIRFALSVEECGLVLDQLGKNNNVLLTCRVPPSEESSMEDVPDKVLQIIAGQGGMANFKVDFELGGVGGQSAAAHGNPNIV